MVKAQAKQTPDEKKEGKKRTSSASSSVKKQDTGTWPCKMDGCKKVFAREADLKRHQRTTKTHSVPGFQCPQCDATFTRTDALRRHQKSRHNGVVIEPAEQDKDKLAGDDGSSGSRSPSPNGTSSRSQGEGSMNGSSPTGSSAPPARAPSYYRPHTMQDGYYPGYPPPPGMMIDPHYPPPPMGLPTSATRGNWHPAPAPPLPWGPEGHHMPPPPPGMYMQSYYPAGYYRPPGMPVPPHLSQINPELLAQSNGQLNGVTPPESALRNTSADMPKHEHTDKDAKMGEPSGAGSAPSSSSHAATPPTAASVGKKRESDANVNVELPGASSDPPPNQQGTEANRPVTEDPDASTLSAATALQAVLAFQKEKEIREAASRASTQPEVTAQPPPPAKAKAQAQSPSSTTTEASPSVGVAGGGVQVDANSVGTDVPQGQTTAQEPQHVSVEQPPEAGPSVVPVHVHVQTSEEENPDLDAVGEPDQEMLEDMVNAGPPDASMVPEQLASEEETPMLNPEELLTQESLASPPPS